MLNAKVELHGQNKEIEISQLHAGYEELASELTVILDRIIIDDMIKISPKEMELSDEEKKSLVIEERNKIIGLMKEVPFTEGDYIYSDETSLYLTQVYGL